MTQGNQMTTHYLGQFQSALRRYRVPQEEEIVAELRNHISEALESGKPLEDIIKALGPCDQLARGYALELLVNPPKDYRATAVVRFLKILSLVIAGSVLSLFIVSTLGLLGGMLLAAGPSLVVGGILQAMGKQPWWIHTGSLPPLAVIAIGPVASLAGWVVCWILWRYVRMTARKVRKIMPMPYPA